VIQIVKKTKSEMFKQWEHKSRVTANRFNDLATGEHSGSQTWSTCSVPSQITDRTIQGKKILGYSNQPLYKRPQARFVA
jgi:hypothetical protein